MTEPRSVRLERAKRSLVVLYACWEKRDYRALGVVVGPRTILTCGHTVTQSRLSDGKLLHVFMDGFPKRLGRCDVVGRWPGSPANSYLGALHEEVLKEGVAALFFKEDENHPRRDRPFWQESIACVAEDRSQQPAYLLSESGLLPWPCETGRGFSGAPVFSADFELIGVHYGRAGCDSSGAQAYPPVVTPLPEGEPWKKELSWAT